MKNKKLIKELDESNFLIERNDGVLITNEFGNYRILTFQSRENPHAKCERETKILNDKALKYKFPYTFKAIKISEYKLLHPLFKF